MSEYVYATNGTPVSNADGEISLPRERIIRCRDCKYFKWWLDDGKQTDSGYCEMFRNDNEYDRWWDVDTDGFCAWGERDVK